MRTSTIVILAVAASLIAAKGDAQANRVNYNNTTPAAPAGTANVRWQNDGGHPTVNATAYVVYPTLQVACPLTGDLSANVATLLSSSALSSGAILDARSCTAATAWSTAVTITKPNISILLPCATLAQSQPITVAAAVRNTRVDGCNYQGSSVSAGTIGGTVLQYSGSQAAFVVGDSSFTQDTPGFTSSNLVINTSGAPTGTAAFLFLRTQEIRLSNLYLQGDGGTTQTAIVLDGTGNYTGGLFDGLRISQFNTGVLGTGDDTALGIDDYANASTFLKMHIDCPTSGGSQVNGTFGFHFAGGDGNTVSGGDVEGCYTMTDFGTKATANTITGLRNENSHFQYVAESGSSYNYVAQGGTFFTGALTDAGEHNSFWDAFHRTANGITGDWYASQQDATVTNHWRLGTGTGNERGLMNEIQTDYGNRWTYGFTDATAGEQFWQVNDLLSNIPRISIGQYNNGTSNNGQTVLNSAGTGQVIFNGSNGSGTGGVIFASGGSSASQVGSVNNLGNAFFAGTLSMGGASTFGASTTVKNLADAEIDATLWAGLTAHQKEAFVYKDYDGSSQWYALKDASNNWALNSAIGGLDAIKAYQSANSGDLYLNTANSTGAIRMNYENGSGTAFDVYGGSSSTLYAAFTAANAIKFPGLAASSGSACIHIDTSGFLTNTGHDCGTGSGTGSVTSVALALPTWLTVSGSPITTSGTFTVTGTSQAPSLFLASPSGSSGAPVMRAIVALDVPTLNQSTTGTAADLSTTLSIAHGGTGTTSSASWPTLNQNTTGNAATATALAATPSTCGAGNYAIGVTATGAATGCAPAGTAQWGTSATFTSTSATQFVGQSSLNNGSQSNPFVAPRAGTVQSCTVEISSAQSASSYYTANLFKNGSLCSSGPTVTLNTTSSNSSVSDNTHTCSVVQGDKLSWQLVPTNTPATSVVSASCLY